MPTSRRDVIKAIGAAMLPAAASGPVFGVAASPAPPVLDPAKAAETEAFLAQFEPAWRVLDPQLRAVLGSIYGGLQGVPPPTELSPSELRRINASLTFYLTAGAPPLPHIEEREIAVPSGRARVRLYDPGTLAPAPTVIYIHGGGWIYGSIDTYDGVTRQLAARSGLRVLSIEYALAPEHPFPAGLDDCIAAIRWAANEGASLGIDPQRIALAGDSAGANLALAACLSLRDAEGSPVRGAALFYGAYSLDFETASQKAYGGGAYFIGTAEIARYWNDYLANEANRKNPLAVPIRADLAGLPPLHVAACECDPLHDDSVKLAAEAKAAGTEAELVVWPKMVHGALSIMGWIDAMGPAADRAAAFLKRVAEAG